LHPDPEGGGGALFVFERTDPRAPGFGTSSSSASISRKVRPPSTLCSGENEVLCKVWPPTPTNLVARPDRFAGRPVRQLPSRGRMMFHCLRNRPAPVRAPSAIRLGIEALEERWVPASPSGLLPFGPVQTTVYVETNDPNPGQNAVLAFRRNPVNGGLTRI